MSKLYSESGFLNQHGEDVFKMVLDENICLLLNSVSSSSELEVVQGLILKRVKDIVSEYKDKISKDK